MNSSKESKEATFYHNSDLEPIKIRSQSHLTPSTRRGPGGKHHISLKRHDFWSYKTIGRGFASRPFPEEQLQNEVWEHRTAPRSTASTASVVGDAGREVGVVDLEDETRYWPWMTDMELAWQPPDEHPVIDLLQMAKPNKRKGGKEPRHFLSNTLMTFSDSVMLLLSSRASWLSCPP